MPTEALLVDKAQLLTLTAPEMTVLIGGMRVLGANFGGAQHGVFTKRKGVLTNDFFVNLLDMSTEWKPFQRTRTCLKAAIAKQVSPDGLARELISSLGLTPITCFGGGLCLRRCQEKFLCDFIAAWNKVMNLDRFELA